MGFWDIFTRKSEERHRQQLEFEREKHELKLELERRKREISLSIDEKRAELERIRLDYQIKEQQENLKEDFEKYDYETEDDEEDNTDDLGTQFLKLLTPVVAQNIISPTNNTTPVSQTPTNNIQINTSENTGVDFTDEEIEELYKAVPKNYRIIAKTLSEDKIREFIKSKYPNVTETSLNKMISRIKR